MLYCYTASCRVGTLYMLGNSVLIRYLTGVGGGALRGLLRIVYIVLLDHLTKLIFMSLSSNY